MKDSLIERQEKKINPQDILTVQEMLEKAGTTETYQFRIFVTYFLIFLFSSYIQMGFPFIFRPAIFDCTQEPICTQQQICKHQFHYLSPTVKSVAYTFDLTCDRKKILSSCFSAFLIGGFIGSLYYGQVLQRKGRRWAVIQSTAVMVIGLYISLLAGNVTMFSIGVLLFNAGFRGFFNASLLTLAEVVNQISRASTPMVLSIGWATGQIFIAIICVWVTSWRVIFSYTAIPLTILLYFVYKYTKQSPRYLTMKHEFTLAKTIIQQIALQNGNTIQNYQLKEQLEYESKMKGYKQIMAGGQISTITKHHSYASLFKFNSIRIRVIFVACIWSIISLSYFISANSFINPNRGYAFNIALAGVIQIIAYFGSMVTSLNFGRVFVIKRLIIAASVVHILFFFFDPMYKYTGFGYFITIVLSIAIRILMSAGNTFLAIYAIQLFPTSIRHYALGMLGFITKLMYMLSFPFDTFWTERSIHPNFVLGVLFIASYFLTSKLRQTKEHPFKDNLSQDGDGTLMDVFTADLF